MESKYSLQQVEVMIPAEQIPEECYRLADELEPDPLDTAAILIQLSQAGTSQPIPIILNNVAEKGTGNKRIEVPMGARINTPYPSQGNAECNKLLDKFQAEVELEIKATNKDNNDHPERLNEPIITHYHRIRAVRIHPTYQNVLHSFEKEITDNYALHALEQMAFMKFAQIIDQDYQKGKPQRNNDDCQILTISEREDRNIHEPEIILSDGPEFEGFIDVPEKIGRIESCKKKEPDAGMILRQFLSREIEPLPRQGSS